jgi:hypothetical protein
VLVNNRVQTASWLVQVLMDSEPLQLLIYDVLVSITGLLGEFFTCG